MNLFERGKSFSNRSFATEKKLTKLSRLEI